MNINILGINIANISKKQILNKIENFLIDGKQHYIVTPNPELILNAIKDEEFFYILNKADLAIPDGIGLKFAGWFLGYNLKRYTGADLTLNILLKKIKIKNSELKIGVINWSNGLSKKKDIQNVLEKYKIKKYFIENIDKQNKKIQNITNLQKFKPDILFITTGAPYQEKFINYNLSNIPSVKIAIGVGGAFDFLTNKIKRAPKILRMLGLEWLWRLLKQPKRIKRIYNAVIKFTWKFFKWRFILPFLYRDNVACLLYKIENNKQKILLVERQDEHGHWQLPQGGTDNQDIKTAGMRELKEEIGNNKFKYITSFKNLWKYKFSKKTGKHKINRHSGHKGQKQNLYIAKFLGNDNDIKINYWDHSNWKWVQTDKLINEISEIRKESMKIFLNKFNNIDMQNKQ
ncbi:MAG: WecB/TagA/CpsF family glycosyltransferase [Methanosarcinaceae archaeon]